MEIITSKSNEKVKFIKSLNEKKFRQKYMCFYLEGIKVVNEVLNSNRAIDIKFIALSSEILKNVNGGNESLMQISSLKNIVVYDIKKEIFENITDTKTPQGILVVLKIKPYTLNDILNDKNSNENILLLDKVQDLGNIGTIIRTADAFNINKILCMEGTADVYAPKVIRSTMGSILREKVVYINKKDLETLRKSDYTIIGTSLNTNKYIQDLDFTKKSIFVLGNEANGISKEVENICDELIKIKMSGNAESLNVSIAAGIIMYLQDK